MIVSYATCTCGAVTLYTDAGESYSVGKRNLRRFFPDIDLRKITRLQPCYMCDHCVNHYGLDLCGCGSGNLFGDCKEGLPECKIPMQVYGKYIKVRAKDAWF